MGCAPSAVYLVFSFIITFFSCWSKCTYICFNVQLGPLTAQQAGSIAAVPQTFSFPKICGCHSEADVRVYSILLGYDFVQTGYNQPVFQGNVLLFFVTSRMPQDTRCIYTGCSSTTTAQLKHTQQCWAGSLNRTLNSIDTLPLHPTRHTIYNHFHDTY